MSALDSVAPNTFCQARFLQPPTLRSPVGLRDALQDKEIHPVSDWGSSGRWFKSCQPDAGQRIFGQELDLALESEHATRPLDLNRLEDRECGSLTNARLHPQQRGR
jgi:hypothetical protein